MRKKRLSPFIEQKDLEGRELLVNPDYFVKKVKHVTGEELSILVDYRLVDKYAKRMKAGDKFVMPIIGSGEIDGLHRVLAGKKLGMKKIPVLFTDY